MKLTPGTSINSGDVVTRQTLADLVNNAAVATTIAESDLSAGTVQNVAQTEPPSSPGPGTMWFDKAEQLMRIWHDEIESTSVSLWLAIGPDRFDVEAIAAEPLPFGAALQLALEAGHKWVKLPPSGQTMVHLGHTAARLENIRVVGFNNTGQEMSATTAESGSWISMSVLGLCWAWFPFNRDDGGSWLAAGRSVNDVNTIISGSSFAGVNSFTAPRGETLEGARGGIVYESSFSVMQDNAPSYCCNSVHRTVATDTHDAHSRVLFFCPRMGRARY